MENLDAKLQTLDRAKAKSESLKENVWKSIQKISERLAPGKLLLVAKREPVVRDWEPSYTCLWFFDPECSEPILVFRRLNSEGKPVTMDERKPLRPGLYPDIYQTLHAMLAQRVQRAEEELEAGIKLIELGEVIKECSKNK